MPNIIPLTNKYTKSQYTLNFVFNVRCILILMIYVKLLTEKSKLLKIVYFLHIYYYPKSSKL